MLAKVTHGRQRAPGAGRPNRSASFDAATFERIVDDLRSGRTPLGQVTITDQQVQGLRVIIRNTGLISYHVNFDAGLGQRRFQKIGESPSMTVERARRVARIILSLASRGVDPWNGVEERLLAEIEKSGEKWKASK